MKIIDGLQFKGNPYEIRDNLRQDFPQFLNEYGCKVGAEVGVYQGDYTEELCRAGLKVYAIDPWKGFSGQGRQQRLQEIQDGYYEIAKKRLSLYPECVIIRKTSMDALNDIPDGSLDFVYLDGDHSFRHIAEDIVEWSKKVRMGGIISGHDYFNTNPSSRNIVCHVKEVVDAYTKSLGINNWYVFGQDASTRGRRFGKCLSWMWIKE